MLWGSVFYVSCYCVYVRIVQECAYLRIAHGCIGQVLWVDPCILVDYVDFMLDEGKAVSGKIEAAWAISVMGDTVVDSCLFQAGYKLG